MKALLRKDYYVLRKTLLLYMVLVAIFALSPAQFTLITALYATLLPNSLFGYDDMSRWGELAAVLPYSDWEIVLSRYVIGWAGVAALNLVGVLSRYVAWALFGGRMELFHSAPPALSGVLLLCAVCVLGIAFMFPIQFRYDMVKARIARMILLMVLAAGVASGLVLASKDGTLDAGLDTLSPWPVVLLAALATAVSIPLSRWAYRKRRG